jgi:hypothetical protein
VLLEFGHRVQEYPHPKIDGVVARMRIPTADEFAKWTKKIRSKRTREYHVDPKSQKVMKDSMGRPLYETEFDLDYAEILETLDEYGESVTGLDFDIRDKGEVPSFAEIVAHEALGWWEDAPMQLPETDARGEWWTDPEDGRTLWVTMGKDGKPVRQRRFNRWAEELYNRIHTPKPYAESDEGKDSRAFSPAPEES